jgi:hypothetical protein
MSRMDVPDWLWQELAADAIWTSIGLGAAWAWKHREAIKQTLKRQPPRTIRVEITDRIGVTDSVSVQTLTGGGIPSSAQAGGGTLTVGK